MQSKLPPISPRHAKKILNGKLQPKTIEIRVIHNSIASNFPFISGLSLNEITDFHLPASPTIFSVLHNLLKSRIVAANRYVLNIFTKEYNVLEHIYNLQKVFLHGAGDLMQTFYSNLFQCVSKCFIVFDYCCNGNELIPNCRCATTRIGIIRTC